MRPQALAPEICLLVGAMAALVGGSFTPRERQWLLRLVALGALAAAAGAGALAMATDTRTVFDGTYAVDVATNAVRVIAASATALTILLGTDELAGDPRESETYALLLFACLGTTAMAGAADLQVLAVAYLLATIPLYGLIGLARTPQAAEAALKTYLLGALSGIVLLLGVGLLYGMAGDTAYTVLTDQLPAAPTAVVAAGFAAVLGGLLFKAGAVPAHFWVPDVAQGSSATAAAFATTVPKVGALVAAYRLVEVLPDTVPATIVLGVLAVASMTLGNLAALGQRDPRRLLGWSTVSQAGYLLVPVAAAGRSDLALPALLLYLAGYAAANLAAFAVTAALPTDRRLPDYLGLSAVRPWQAAALLIALLGLVGTPPTAVFAGKLTVAAAALDAAAAWLAVALLANTALSLGYYLRWIAPSYRRPRDVGPAPRTVRPAAATAAVLCAALVLGLGVAAGGLWSVFDAALFR